MQSRRQPRAGRGKEGNLPYGPYLIISREKGAGGCAVAQLAAKRLSWQLVNSESVDAIAKKANVRRELIESLDERDRGAIEEVIERLLRPQSLDKSGYLAHLREILLTLGHQGDVVIVCVLFWPSWAGFSHPQRCTHFLTSHPQLSIILTECAGPRWLQRLVRCLTRPPDKLPRQI